MTSIEEILDILETTPYGSSVLRPFSDEQATDNLCQRRSFFILAQLDYAKLDYPTLYEAVVQYRSTRWELN